MTFLDPSRDTLAPADSVLSELADTGTPPPANLGLLRELMATWTHWPAKRREVIHSQILTAAWIAKTGELRRQGKLDRIPRRDVSPYAIPTDPAWLNARLFQVPPKALGMKESTVSCTIWGVRTALREVGLLDPVDIPPAPPGSAWATLLDGIAAGHEQCRIGLIGFAAWCHRNGIAPNQVVDETLARYGDYRNTRTLREDIPGLLANVAKAWRKTVFLVTHKPQIVLRPPSRSRTYAPPLTTYPQPLQDEIARFLGRLSGATYRGPFRVDGLKQPLAPLSVKHRRDCIRVALAALIHDGRDQGTITSLADLVEEDAMRAILQFHWDRKVAQRVAAGEFASIEDVPRKKGVTSYTGAIAQTLMMIAKYHCRLPTEIIEQLNEIAADLRPPRQSEITDKNLARLDQFDDPAVRRNLLELPERLMAAAEKMLAKSADHPDRVRMPKDAARLARKAVALEILLHVPLRLGNLCHLKEYEHLKYDGRRSPRINRLLLQPHETKNTLRVEWSVGPELAEFLECYIRRFRPLLAAEGSPWLFPGDGGDKAISDDMMRDDIEAIVADGTGAIVNPHLFRAFAARLALEDNAAALEDIRLLLGDKTLSTVIAHYAALKPAVAARRFDDVLRRARNHGKQGPKAGRGK